MKIAYLTPGAGPTFYCQNCFRDSELLKALLVRGFDAIEIPMYLPSTADTDRSIVHAPVFYGAINIYLKEKIPAYRHAPNWLERFFDLPLFLRLAASKSGSTRPAGLEDMTLSMLRGEEGRQASELDHLIHYLRKDIRPDVIHLSNALLLGLARRMKRDLGAAVVCSLQDENEWIDLMDGRYQGRVWDLMAERAADVDLFVAPSRYYADRAGKQLKLPEEKIKVVLGGIAWEGYEQSPLPFHPPVIGYLCRMSEYFGLGLLVDAFLRLKTDDRFRDLRLHLAGGYAGDDKPFVQAMLKKIGAAGFGGDVEIFRHFDRKHRIQFLRSLTLLSVPVPSGEAFGAYQVEALAAGVPIVQPRVGAFPEFVKATSGGVIYEPNNAPTLAATLAALLADREAVRSYAETGRQAVRDHFSMEEMARRMIRIYEEAKSASRADAGGGPGLHTREGGTP